jgi:hypothetical protein
MSTTTTNGPRGFVAVQGRRHAAILARAGRGYVWARRVLPGGLGWHPAPACIFIGYESGAEACADMAQVRAVLGWSCSVSPGSGGSQVVQAVTGSIPLFVLKVRLPAGITGRAAYADIATVCGSGFLPAFLA